MQPKYHMTKEQNIFLAKRNIVDYIWKSANLEGIGVTYPDTQAIYNDMSVAGYKVEEIDAVNDLKHAWQLLLSTIDAPLNLAYVKKIHLQLGRRTVINAGSLRLSDANIGGTNWIPNIPDEMELEKDIEEIKGKDDILDQALNMALYLMRSQIFYDGNKRLSMMIGNKIMIENGMGIISVPQDKISGFYDRLIPFYETGDLKEIKQFLYDFCIDGMEFPEGAKIPEK